MITVNEAGWDRTLRVFVGVVLLYLGGAGMATGWLAGVAIGAGIILLVTGLVGWCPLYSLLGVSTRHRSTPGAPV